MAITALGTAQHYLHLPPLEYGTSIKPWWCVTPETIPPGMARPTHRHGKTNTQAWQDHTSRHGKTNTQASKEMEPGSGSWPGPATITTCLSYVFMARTSYRTIMTCLSPLYLCQNCYLEYFRCMLLCRCSTHALCLVRTRIIKSIPPINYIGAYFQRWITAGPSKPYALSPTYGCCTHT